MTRRFWIAAVAALAIVGLIGVITVRAVRPDPKARIIVMQDVPDDVLAEMNTTWGRFIDRFADRRTCFADVTVVLVDRVEGGDARYVGDEALIEIQIPTTPARFRESLTHELAHHVERTCDEFDDLRTTLHPQFGGPDRPWNGGETWEETPSELWAEAVVALVNGERLLHADDMPIDEDAIDQIAEWGAAPSSER